jgi:ribosomal protein S18 acetylase RimI-like enzyme
MRPGADHLFIENVAVHPDHQGRGLGQRLLARAESEAGARGLPALRLYTNVKMTENFPFYEALGFVETERRREDGFDRVYMEKRLG